MLQLRKPQTKLILAILATGLLIIFYQFLRGHWDLPASFKIGPLQIYFYSLFVLAGIGVTAFLFKSHLHKYKEFAKIDVEEALLWVIIPAVIGARLWHVGTEWDLYRGNIIEALYIWQGGLGIYGGLIGGKIGAFLYTRNKGIHVFHIVDLLVVFLPLGHAIGRFGNFFNQEIYGPITTMPWGQYIRATGEFHHPLFLYEQIGNLILFAILYRQYKKNGLTGKPVNIATYVAGYGLLRFILEFYRTTPEANQWVSLVMVVVAGSYLIRRNLKSQISNTK